MCLPCTDMIATHRAAFHQKHLILPYHLAFFIVPPHMHTLHLSRHSHPRLRFYPHVIILCDMDCSALLALGSGQVGRIYIYRRCLLALFCSLRTCRCSLAFAVVYFSFSALGLFVQGLGLYMSLIGLSWLDECKVFQHEPNTRNHTFFFFVFHYRLAFTDPDYIRVAPDCFRSVTMCPRLHPLFSLSLVFVICN